jgi:hypothetical protein
MKWIILPVCGSNHFFQDFYVNVLKFIDIRAKDLFVTPALSANGQFQGLPMQRCDVIRKPLLLVSKINEQDSTINCLPLFVKPPYRQTHVGGSRIPYMA